MRVTKQPNGSYVWNCPIDPEYHRQTMRSGWRACLIVGAVVLGFGVLTALMNRTPTTLWVALLVDAIFIGMSGFMIRQSMKAKDPLECYVMSEASLQIGYGRSAVPTPYKKVEEFRIASGYMELCYGKKVRRFYVPEEDREFVRDYIRSRLPASALICEENAES
jgi:hypothetical protein